MSDMFQSYHHLQFESISRNQTQIVNVKNSPYLPDPPIMGDTSMGELHFQFVNQVSHKNPKKSRTKPALPRRSTQDVNTATFADPWVEYMNLDYVKPFSEMFSHFSHNILFT